MKNEIYLIIFEYSTDDCNGIDTYLYNTREKAINKLQELIKTEKDFYKDEYSHIDSTDFEIDTNICLKVHGHNQYRLLYYCLE